MKVCEELDIRQARADSQIIEVILDPDETVVAETGAFLACGPDIKLESRLGQVQGQGAKTAVKSTSAAVKRKIAGERLFVTHMTNTSDYEQESVWLAAPYPGDIIPIDMGDPTIGGEILCQRGAFLAAAHGTTIGMHIIKKIGAGLFGGEGMILQRVQGDGMLLLHAGGSYQALYIEDSELQVDTGCLVAFSPNFKYTISRSGSLRSMLFSGEGLFLATLRGTGWVYIQSLPLERLTAMLSRQLRQLQRDMDKRKK